MLHHEFHLHLHRIIEKDSVHIVKPYLLSTETFRTIKGTLKRIYLQIMSTLLGVRFVNLSTLSIVQRNKIHILN